MIHCAKLEKSERLQRIYGLLTKRGPRGATTREIDRECDTVCVHTGIAELKANGIKIVCKPEYGAATKRRVFRYFLEPLGFWHLTIDGYTTVCGQTSTFRINAHYRHRKLDVGEWCRKCQIEYDRPVSRSAEPPQLELL